MIPFLMRGRNEAAVYFEQILDSSRTIPLARAAQSEPGAACAHLEARTGVRLELTYDERIEDGLYCARMLERLTTYTEDPASWAGSA